jgi:hypothetical protein
MGTPSFLYSALDEETQRLAGELARLGGGDATAVNIEVHAVLDDRLDRHENQTIWLNKASIDLRDALLPIGTPIAQCMKSYSLSGSCRLQDILQYPSDHFIPVRELCDWVRSGFNASLITYGERSSGKTATLFGFENKEKNDELLAEAAASVSTASTVAERETDKRSLLARGGVSLIVLKELYDSKQQLELDCMGGSNMPKMDGPSATRLGLSLGLWVSVRYYRGR